MEGAIAQDSKDPSSSKADRSFDNSLIPWLSYASWNHRHIEMAGHLCKTRIDVRLIRRGFRNDGLWIVGNTDFWAPLKKVKASAWPVHQASLSSCQNSRAYV